MIILVGSKIDQSSIQSSLGKPEYSYYFLMKDFLPLLERLGSVVIVDSIAEIESLTAAHREAGEQVVFFSFSPPHQVPLGLPCKTIAVFAWEFDSLPNMPWNGNPQNDWNYAFARIHGAISTSQEAAALVANSMPPGYPVMASPAPVWNRFADLFSAPAAPDLGERTFRFQGLVIDSPLLGLSADGLVRKPEPVVQTEPEPVSLPEPQEKEASRWESQLRDAWLASGALARDWWQEMRTPLRVNEPVQASIVPEALPEELPELPELQELPEEVPEPVVAVPHPEQTVSVSGVVYTTVLNPGDSRKNWVEIVTAFCWAFKDVPDATLVVKMTHHDIEFYRIVLMTLLSRLAPFQCRVVVLHGFLDDAQYRALIQATTFYVNASSGEGLCLPLMEFLSAGKPSIAPTHTAMADYMDEQLGFVIKCAAEPFCWPHDPTGVFMTHRQRLNWESLMEAFRRSYQVPSATPEEYQHFASNAFCRMRDFASVDVLEQPLRTFLDEVLVSERDPSVPVSVKAGQKP